MHSCELDYFLPLIEKWSPSLQVDHIGNEQLEVAALNSIHIIIPAHVHNYNECMLNLAITSLVRAGSNCITMMQQTESGRAGVGERERERETDGRT